MNNTLHDLVIRNGKILDGSGNKAFFGDIAIDDGKILRSWKNIKFQEKKN